MRGFDEMARRDKNQLAVGFQVVQAFVDEKHIQVRAFVISAGQFLLRCCGDVLETHVGRVGDNGVEAFVSAVVEEVLMVQLDMRITRACVLDERAIDIEGGDGMAR